MKPIIFSTPMVQAILAGHKTQTRRVIKPQPLAIHTQASPLYFSPSEKRHYVNFSNADDEYCKTYYSKLHPGNTLWVRETWCDFFSGYLYKANGGGAGGGKWRPSIHMPREAARVFLRVTDVRVERVRDINEASAIAEGVPTENPMEPIYCPACDGDGFAIMCVNGGALETDCPHCDTAVKRYANLWNNLNAKRGYGWETNPWVWVYTFERCDAPDDCP